ncbi:MAG: DUF7096 domain-containing protein [archaeon]
MKRGVVLAVAGLLVVAFTVAGSGAVAATTGDAPPATGEPIPQTATTTNETTSDENATTTENETTANDSDASVAAGAKMAGIIGAQKAEHESTVQSGAFEKAIERAGSNESRAAIVANSTERTQDRLQELENESERLEAQYENETLPESAYYAKLTVLTARTSALERQANQTSTRARTLPAPALEARGISASEVQAVEKRAKNVTNPRAADVAKRVAGPEVGQPTGPPKTAPGHDENRGPSGTDSPPDESGNGQHDSPPGQSDTPGQAGGNGTTENSTHGTSSSEAWGQQTDDPKNASETGTFQDPPGQNRSNTNATQSKDRPAFAGQVIVDSVLGFFG